MRRPHRVVILAYDGLCTFEFGIAVEAFALARPELKVPWYRCRVGSLEPGPIRGLGNLTLEPDGGIRLLLQADTIVIPGWRDPDETPPASLLNALRRAYAGGARLVAICSGAFVLASAGLLDGKRATTHWRYATQLAACFPQVSVQPDVLYVDEGRILTSAGSAAGIDLCLHLIRKDFGAAVANQVARRLVVAPHRSGGQSQYIPQPVTEEPAGLAPLLDWARANLRRPLSVPTLARRAAMSPRTFARHFRAVTGTTPHRWVTHQRLLGAQHLLETTSASIDRVAEAVGLETAANLQHHFRELLQTTPTAYRQQFFQRSSGG